MKSISSIAVLLTCHNRKEKTINCLCKLFECVKPEHFSFEVFLVDDGSTDGTGTAILNQFPEVRIIQGSGDLYWNRGMHLAWQTAANFKDFDYYLWLNDDTFLYKNALRTLILKTFDTAIIVGATQSKESKELTYGGYKKASNRKLLPNGTFQECDYLNGNCVLVPRVIFNKIGNLDPVFHHAIGDFDYGLRAKKSGFNLFLAPDFVATCESHDSLPKWMSPNTPIHKRLRNLYLPTSGCSPKQYFVFDKRHNGLFSACFHFFTIHLRAIIPSLWKLKSK